MSDQCKNCESRGDLLKCTSTDCFQHDNWFPSALRAELGKRHDSLLEKDAEIKRLTKENELRVRQVEVMRKATVGLTNESDKYFCKARNLGRQLENANAKIERMVKQMMIWGGADMKADNQRLRLHLQDVLDSGVITKALHRASAGKHEDECAWLNEIHVRIQKALAAQNAAPCSIENLHDMFAGTSSLDDWTEWKRTLALTGKLPNKPAQGNHVVDGNKMVGHTQNPSYGFCPICGAPGKMRERGFNGNDRCEAGHVYPSAKSLNEKPAQGGKE